MISIFNGRSRTLGQDDRQEYYVQVSVEFRRHLHRLKGAKLAVFMCISLHTDKNGWSRPSIPTIAKETGYSEDTVFDALKELEALVIEGYRILYRLQPRLQKGLFQSNRYLIFPSPQELRKLELSSDRPDISPTRKKTDTGKNRHGEMSGHEVEPVFKENQEEKNKQQTNKVVVVQSEFSFDQYLAYAESQPKIENPRGFATSAINGRMKNLADVNISVDEWLRSQQPLKAVSPLILQAKSEPPMPGVPDEEIRAQFLTEASKQLNRESVGRWVTPLEIHKGDGAVFVRGSPEAQEWITTNYGDEMAAIEQALGLKIEWFGTHRKTENHKQRQVA